MESHTEPSTIANLSTNSALLRFFGNVLAPKSGAILRLLPTLQQSSVL